MRIATAWSEDAIAVRAVDTAVTTLLTRLAGWPSYVFATASAALDISAASARLAALLPEVPIHGMTSCFGALTEEGFHSSEGGGLALWGARDSRGCYGVGLAEWSEAEAGSARAAGRAAALSAVADAGRPGEAPALVWLSGTPGREEEVLAGIEDVLGANVPIAGGSAADNDMAGAWWIFTATGARKSAVLVSAMFPTANVRLAFDSGYRPTAQAGRVGGARGRLIEALDSHPAAAVYDAWSGGRIAGVLQAGGDVRAHTRLYPLGQRMGDVGETGAYLVLHPQTMTDEGAMTFLAEVEDGAEVALMEGSRDSLLSRAGRVVEDAIADRPAPARPATAESVCGALMTYGAGCLLTVKDRIEEVSRDIDTVLGGRAFLGAFTFGEQGRFRSAGNRHGTLMISAAVFSK